MDKQPSLCFIIACKCYKTYDSYIPFYVSNINEYYPDAKIILVDNNSVYKDPLLAVKDNPSVTILENTSPSKFELGAYNFAAEYILQNNLEYDYYICTQDTFVLVNKYDFNTLMQNNIAAASLGHFYFHRASSLHIRMLQYLGIYDPAEEFLCCWCSSWVVSHTNLLKIRIMFSSILLTERYHSMETERYMGKILKLLNNNNSYAIEQVVEGNNYNCHTIDPRSIEAKNTGNYFIKRAQQKNEKTPE
jgi:hypothetical protein